VNSIPVLLALALAPSAYLASAMYLKDKYQPEPKRVLLDAFLAGCLLIVPAAILESLAIKVLDCKGPTTGQAFLMAFIVAALIEEGLKFWLLRSWAYRRKEFDEPLDGIVYGSFIALGFATVENVLYVFQNGFSAAVLRMFTSVPAHYSFGIIMGYCVGKAKFESHKQLTHMFRGLFYAVLLHGSFDFFLMQKAEPALGVLTVVTLVVALRIGRKEIKELQLDSCIRAGNSLEVCNAPSLQPIPVHTPPPLPPPLPPQSSH
jgi:protease PrsW